MVSAPEAMCPEEEEVNQKVNEGGVGKRQLGQGRLKIAREGAGRAKKGGKSAGPHNHQEGIKNRAAESMKGRLEKRGDSPRGLYRQENKRKAVAKQRKMTGKDTWFTGGKDRGKGRRQEEKKQPLFSNTYC